MDDAALKSLAVMLGLLAIESSHYEDDEAHDVARLMARRIAA